MEPRDTLNASIGENNRVLDKKLELRFEYSRPVVWRFPFLLQFSDWRIYPYDFSYFSFHDISSFQFWKYHRTSYIDDSYPPDTKQNKNGSSPYILLRNMVVQFCWIRLSPVLCLRNSYKVTLFLPQLQLNNYSKWIKRFSLASNWLKLRYNNFHYTDIFTEGVRKSTLSSVSLVSLLSRFNNTTSPCYFSVLRNQQLPSV